MKKPLRFFLRLFFGLGLLFYLLLYKTNPGEIIRVLKETNLWLVGLAFSLHAVGLWISAIRWKIILDEQSPGHGYSRAALVGSYLVGTFFNHFLPTRFGGDIIRVTDTRKAGGFSASFAVVIYERLSGLLVLVGFALIASLVKIAWIRQIPILYISLGISIVLLGLFVFIWTSFTGRLLQRLGERFPSWDRLLQPIQKVHLAMHAFMANRKLAVKVFFWAMLLQFNVVIHYYFLGRALHLGRIPFLDYFFTIPILLFFLTLPVSINGIGVRDWILVKCFAVYSHNASLAVAFSLLDLLFNLILGVLGGGIYLFRRRKNHEKSNM